MESLLPKVSTWSIYPVINIKSNNWLQKHITFQEIFWSYPLTNYNGFYILPNAKCTKVTHQGFL